MKLSPKKWRFVELLAQGYSYEKAGKEMGISKATVWRWANDPAVKARLSELQTERLKQAHGKLLKATETAIDTLVNLCHAKSGYVAVQAAKTILDLALKLEETLNLQSRIEAIEERLKELETKEA